MGPKRPEAQDEKMSIQVPVEGVELIHRDPNVKPNKLVIYRPKNSDTVDIGQDLLGKKLKSISKNHARITFKDSKVSITDVGSSKGTWVQSKKGALKQDLPHVLKDGDRIVFGAKEDKGIIEDPDALRMKVKFLTETPPANKQRPLSTTSDKDKAASPKGKDGNKGLPSVDVSTGNLQPPATNQHRRTTSLQATEKPKGLASSDAASIQSKKTPHTVLERETHVPWSESFRPGFGIDAVTGEFMARSALQQFKMVELSKPGKSRISVERLEWKGAKELQDGFEVEVGATVNALCPVGANTKVASVLSQNSSTSTILVQYRVEANFLREFIPENVRLKEELGKLSDKEFREEYGDYYIAGYDKAYSCRMIVVCKINEETVNDSLEREAKAVVGEYFKGGIKISEIEKQTQSFSLLSVVVDTEGCSPDPTGVFSVAVADAPQLLSRILKNAHGIPRTAILYHYSRVDSCKLSRRVDVPKRMFDRARLMRGTYAYLQASLLHPALQEFPYNHRTINAVLKRFEDQRKSMVQIATDDQRKKIDALQRDLTSSKDKADALIRRYDFIRIVSAMNKGIVSHPPTLVNGLHFYRWDCGKTGALKKVTELKEYNLVCFEPSYKAFELEWQSPVTDGAPALLNWLGLPSARENMTFDTRNSANILPPLPPPSSKGHKLSKVRHAERPSGGPPNTDTFSFCLADHKPVYILGWSISCYWPEGKAEPTIEVDHPSNHILSDRLSISVDTSRSTQWHCKVTFVIRSSNNFPDLL